MKLVWCPETATKAYMDAVKSMSGCCRPDDETDVAELVSAMAGGWKAQLIVEAWASGDGPATSLGLSAAARHTGGRHVCAIIPDRDSAAEYEEAMKKAGNNSESSMVVVVGEAEVVMKGLEGVEMLVVDFRRRDAGRLLKEARAGPRGMVVVCKNGGVVRGGEAVMVRRVGTRLVRSVFLPVGRGVEILYVGVGNKGPRLGGGGSRWIKHVDRVTGEEHVFRRE